MISKALHLVFFWRRNHLPSITFKSAFWGFVTWLAVGMFTNVRLALIAAAVIAIMSAVKYGLRKRQQTQKLMAMCEGDPQKFAALQEKLNTPGMGGALIREMLNAEISDDDEDDLEHEDEVDTLSDEERQSNINANAHLVRKMATLTREASLISDVHCDEVEQELLEEHDTGEERIDLEELVSAFLPDNAISISQEDYINEDDHAALVEEFSAATNNRWQIEGCSSSFDAETEKWVVSFKENNKEKTWRFTQDSDWLNDNFLTQLINYTQQKSGYTVSVLNTEDFVSLVCLPQGMFHALNDNDKLQHAA